MPASNITVVPKTASTDEVTIDTNASGELQVKDKGINGTKAVKSLTNGSTDILTNDTSEDILSVPNDGVYKTIKTYQVDNQTSEGKVQINFQHQNQDGGGSFNLALRIVLNGTQVYSATAEGTSGAWDTLTATDITLPSGNNTMLMQYRVPGFKSTQNCGFRNVKIQSNLIFAAQEPTVTSTKQ